MSQQGVVNAEYFLSKRNHTRKRVVDTSGNAFEAIEIATKVLRLCYPIRYVKAIHCYYNNEPIEPFLRPQHPGVKGWDQPITEHIIVDVYFLFDDEYASKDEDDAFVVEVVFPQGTERTRWDSLARVRWIDLGWTKMGQYNGDSPVPQLGGETFVNMWM